MSALIRLRFLKKLILFRDQLSTIYSQMRPEKASHCRRHSDEAEELARSCSLPIIPACRSNILRNCVCALLESTPRSIVIKNTFIKRAIKSLGLPELNGAHLGGTAMVTGESDTAPPPKCSRRFVTEFERPPVKGGILDDEILNADQIKPWPSSRRRMSCKRSCSSLLLAPATKLVRVLHEPAGQPRSPSQSQS